MRLAALFIALYTLLTISTAEAGLQNQILEQAAVVTADVKRERTKEAPATNTAIAKTETQIAKRTPSATQTPNKQDCPTATPTRTPTATPTRTP